ncbi:flagellar biosynthesis anti-sigma factor FlgM [Paenibacillus lemnae]|uniref:Negative regulator of flagellin synthesis n=1 Tax=Paenibacillus lemnae TaxID=1330551 RepID=A0A848M955_PAELE|nr:flagellar biosynthesis anti-sigma factor FlgM [Paenibacillus lemnae]NMO96612.1 flagellar biosynthesis anti-sigma factor FlgM [Paenibacillus lemnae]
MKINESGRVTGVQHYQRNVESHRQEDAKKTRRKDEVSISTEAMEMLQAQEKTQDTDRAQRIQDLKSQVAAGTYTVDAEKLAERLLPHFKQFTEK